MATPGRGDEEGWGLKTPYGRLCIGKWESGWTSTKDFSRAIVGKWWRCYETALLKLKSIFPTLRKRHWTVSKSVFCFIDRDATIIVINLLGTPTSIAILFYYFFMRKTFRLNILIIIFSIHNGLFSNFIVKI